MEPVTGSRPETRSNRGVPLAPRSGCCRRYSAKAATSKAEQARLQQTIQFMRKYSSQYSLDYLLMAAQGYQESGLDQSRRSAVGALGVMQVMPATGKDMNVGDITVMESNIHAGVKYMRFMMDRYYADEPMDTLNKGLFTFASYNAGPARIRQLLATGDADRIERDGTVRTDHALEHLRICSVTLAIGGADQTGFDDGDVRHR